MDTSLILITIGLLGIFHFMSVITLKKKLESLQKAIDKQKEYWKSVEYSIEIQSNKISGEIEEELNVLIQDVGLLACQINKSKEDINKTTKEQVSRIIYTVPMIDLSMYARKRGGKHGN